MIQARMPVRGKRFALVVDTHLPTGLTALAGSRGILVEPAEGQDLGPDIVWVRFDCYRYEALALTRYAIRELSALEQLAEAVN